MSKENATPATKNASRTPTPTGRRPGNNRRPNGTVHPVLPPPLWRRVAAGLALALANACAAALIVVPALALMMPGAAAEVLSLPVLGSILLAVWVQFWVSLAAPVLLGAMLFLYLLAYGLRRLAQQRLPIAVQLLLHVASAALVALLVVVGYDGLLLGLSASVYFDWALEIAFILGCLLELLPGGAPWPAVISRSIDNMVGQARRRIYPGPFWPWMLAGVAGVGLVMSGLVGQAWHSAWLELFGPDYEFIDSGVATRLEQIYWLDNRRVIFSGSREPRTQKGAPQAEILIWDTKTNTVEAYRDIPRGKLFCYADGRVFYDLYMGERPGMKYPARIFMAGPLGEEIKHVFSMDGALNGRYRFNMFSCRLAKRPEAVPDGGGWMPLKKEHGFLRFVPVEDKYYMNVVYYYDSKSMKLPFNDEETWPTIAQWYALQGGYFMYEPATNPRQRSHWQETNCLRAWRLYPGGETEPTCIPAGIWTKYGVGRVAPIRDGYFFPVKATPEVSGAYVIRHGKSTKVISGLPEKPAVSPNGCRIAFAHVFGMDALRPDTPERWTLKMIDVCDERLSEKLQ